MVLKEGSRLGQKRRKTTGVLTEACHMENKDKSPKHQSHVLGRVSGKSDSMKGKQKTETFRPMSRSSSFSVPFPTTCRGTKPLEELTSSVFFSWKIHGQESLVLASPLGWKEWFPLATSRRQERCQMSKHLHLSLQFSQGAKLCG